MNRQTISRMLIPLLVASISSFAFAETAELRGYGRVTAIFPDRESAIFHCQSAEKADILLGKMLADLFWDAGNQVTTSTLRTDGTSLTIRKWNPYSEICAGRDGATVFAVGGATDADLIVRLKKLPNLNLRTAIFNPVKSYPRYLDHYDLRAYKAYTHAMASEHNLGLDSHWKFLRQFGMGGIAFQDLGLTNQNPAPGVVSFTSADYEIREADRNGGAATIGLATGGEAPLWIYNLNPDSMMRPAPTTLLGAWGGTATGGSHYESWWLSQQQRADGAMDFTRRAMERYRNNPALSGWHLYTGSPGAEFGFHDRTGEFWDYSPTGKAVFRAWLKDVRNIDLPALGTRWYGDPLHFKSWDQVDPPDPNTVFFDGLPAGTAKRLDTGWQWATARVGQQNPPASGSAAWFPVAMPPSQRQTLLPWGEAFYRVGFDAKPNAPLWLSCAALLRSGNPVVVWLNGEKIAELKSVNNPMPFSVDLAGKLKSGANKLVLRIPRQSEEKADSSSFGEGKLFGPVYLSNIQPKRYPDLGPQGNARYSDLRAWQIAGVEHAHRSMLDEAYALDPDHPFNLSGDAGVGCDVFSRLAAEYGASCQHTGREAWYHPWWPGIGMLGGFYGTGEESGTASEPILTRELAWMMIDGDSNHNLFWDIEDYQNEEKKSGWFTRNKRAIQCFGKYLRAMPKIAILRSGRCIQLGSEEPWNHDLGRGDLQSLHYDNAYATETELLNGKADVCPILFDSGNDILDSETIEGIRSYVSKGGTFVALPDTGLRPPAGSNENPLARLTGLTTRPHGDDTLAFETGAPLFSSMAGSSFRTSGVALTPPANKAVEAVARWSDGSIAIAVVPIGKGRILQLGSWFFWDRGATERRFMESLFGALGIVRDADASDGHIWTRHAITKNGLEDWLIACNDSDQATTADVRLRAADRPEVVRETLAGESVSFTYENGVVSIHEVNFSPHGLHIYAVKRANLAGGLPFWWAEKTKYWSVPPAAASANVHLAQAWIKSADARSVASGRTVPFTEWRIQPDADPASDGWMQPEYNANGWQLAPIGPWNLMHLNGLEAYRGTMRYRSEFSVPSNWSGRRIILHLFDWDRPIAYDQALFYINGKQVGEYHAHGWSQGYAFDVTDLLLPGHNSLAVRVTGGKEFSGIGGSIWLEPELKVTADLDLAGEWRLMNPAFRLASTTVLPGSPTGRSIQREFTLDRNWFSHRLYLHLETPSQWLGLISVNGRPICTNGFMHPFAPRAEVNLTPYLREGKNTIELWPFSTTPNVYAENSSQIAMPVTAVKLVR